MDYRIWPLGWLKVARVIGWIGWIWDIVEVHYTPYPEYNYPFLYGLCNDVRLGYYRGYYFSSLRRKICETWRTIRLPRRRKKEKSLFVNPSGWYMHNIVDWIFEYFSNLGEIGGFGWRSSRLSQFIIGTSQQLHHSNASKILVTVGLTRKYPLYIS